MEIIINGGIIDTDQIKKHLMNVDGVMIGRAIYHSPYFLADIEREIFNNKNIPTREELDKQLKTNVVNKRNAIKFELDQLELSTQRLTQLIVSNRHEN